jgi:hypothetical protein
MRKVVEDCIVLDSNKASREEWFNEPRWSTVTWGRGDKITFSYENGLATLHFTLKGKSHEQSVPVEKAPCHYGGFRHYFHCPGCRKRVCKLIQGGKGFYCRGCYSFPYFTQQAGFVDGLVAQRERIEVRLMDKTKRRNKRRLITQLLNIERRVNDEAIRLFGQAIF